MLGRVRARILLDMCGLSRKRDLGEMNPTLIHPKPVNDISTSRINKGVLVGAHNHVSKEGSRRDISKPIVFSAGG